MNQEWYSDDWYQATDKFRKSAEKHGSLNWCAVPKSKYDIPYVKIGNGKNKIVINSGLHGIEGYFGSAAQLMFLDKFAKKLTPEFLSKYTIVLIHVINGWGMQKRMREVEDKKNGGLVDLNRNFGVDFNKKENLPKNPKYSVAHDLLLSCPDKVVKKNAIKEFRRKHLKDGVWSAISNGQYEFPYGLFYGGSEPMQENKMTMKIYDDIMQDATSLVSIGLHTGLGYFDRKKAYASSQLLVSHPSEHNNTQFFKRLFNKVPVIADENAINGPTLLGDLVDALEMRYADRNIPIYTADFEIGTGEFPIMSPIYKRMDMGDARYDLLHYGKINVETWQNLTESWYPSDKGWRVSALQGANMLFQELLSNIEKQSLIAR